MMIKKVKNSMKILVVAFAVVFSFNLIAKPDNEANNASVKVFAESADVNLLNDKNKKADDSDEFCKVSCSVTVGGITYEASAGWLLTSCASAAEKCAGKLAEVVAALQ